MPPRVVGDAARLSQALINLLSNAIKFSERGVVRLRASVRGEFLAFEVSDHGIGLTPEQIKALFKPFAQTDSSITRRYGGTGLGLAITKRIAQQLGGDVAVKSVQGEGSQFTLTTHLETAPIEDELAAVSEASGQDFEQSCCPIFSAAARQRSRHRQTVQEQTPQRGPRLNCLPSASACNARCLMQPGSARR